MFIVWDVLSGLSSVTACVTFPFFCPGQTSLMLNQNDSSLSGYQMSKFLLLFWVSSCFTKVGVSCGKFFRLRV